MEPKKEYGVVECLKKRFLACLDQPNRLRVSSGHMDTHSLTLLCILNSSIESIVTKGIDLLIKAYAYLIEKGGNKDAVLVIAGPDDGYLKEAKSLTSALDILKHVLFTGPLYRQDKLETYVDSDVLVLPSRYETFPMTVLEAYTCGKPVIASEIGGLKDLIINEKTGILVKLENKEQLAKGIFSLVNDNNLAKEIGQECKQFVRENFMIEDVVAKNRKGV